MTQWFPFKNLAYGNQIADFDLDDVAKILDLSDVQCALLSYLLRDLDLTIWFEGIHDEHDKNSLSLTLFFQKNLVAKIDLIDALKEEFSQRYEIGTEEELEVLERLRDCITAEIALRQEEKKAPPESGEASDIAEERLL